MAGAEMATSATEQPDVAMDSSLAVQSEVSATMLGRLPLVVDMKFGNPCGVQQWHVVGDAA